MAGLYVSCVRIYTGMFIGQIIYGLDLGFNTLNAAKDSINVDLDFNSKAF